MLGPRTLFVTILREPVDQFESLFDYAGLAAWFGLQDLADYIQG